MSIENNNAAAVVQLSADAIEQGWHRTFSTSNPYCPCNLKSFTKAVRWAEHAIAQATPPAAADANTPPIAANPAEIAPGTLPYRTEPTDALLEVLGLMLYTTTPIAHALRAAGTDIPKRCEEEQAYVLHWLIQLALQHGAGWRERARQSIEELQAATHAHGEVRA
ncbi:hypothetical protein LMG19282_04213 [Cupriavidus campinensis]|uniref:hypothetical protein n=1 Tax=Cupriavidus campinensis TaxID=151783 RepID=UPI001B1AEE32|nr:hypothetical protein [Cupriavidus campinensis]CAG2152545.1 hypothetical protein LMG19282_04213 [Cupriavidus campinensis]